MARSKLVLGLLLDLFRKDGHQAKQQWTGYVSCAEPFCAVQTTAYQEVFYTNRVSAYTMW